MKINETQNHYLHVTQLMATDEIDYRESHTARASRSLDKQPNAKSRLGWYFCEYEHIASHFKINLLVLRWWSR